MRELKVERCRCELPGTSHDDVDAGNLPAPESAQQPREAPEPASGPSEDELRDFSTSGLVRIRLRDAAMAVQQASPQVRASSAS